MTARRKRRTRVVPWGRVLKTLSNHYGTGKWRTPVLRERGADPFHVLVSTALSHRTRDEATLEAFNALVRDYPNARALARADAAEVRRLIRPVGLSKAKAIGLVRLAKALVDGFDGKVPSSYEELLTLPLVGPKTASAVRVFGFEKQDLPVDVHIHRVVNRMGAVAATSLQQTQEALREVVPKRYWKWLNPVLVQHGQNICLARKPRCGSCPIRRWCDWGSASGRPPGVLLSVRTSVKVGRRHTPPARYLRDGRAPVPKKESTSRVMSANRGRSTGPEVAVRQALRLAGVSGFRANLKGLPGRPDLAFTRERVAVFVHGCFWHRCPQCRLPLPKSHTAFWRNKFERNRARDIAKGAALRKAGWKVVVVWECQARRDIGKVVGRVERAISPRRG